MAKEIKMSRIMKKLEAEYGFYPKKKSSKEIIYLFGDFEENERGEWIPLYLHITDGVAFATLNRRKWRSFSSEEELILFIEDEVLDLYPDEVNEDAEEYPWEQMEERRQYWF